MLLYPLRLLRPALTFAAIRPSVIQMHIGSTTLSTSPSLTAVQHANNAFAGYYRTQHICESEADLLSLMEMSSSPLPIYFRMNPHCSLHTSVIPALQLAAEGTLKTGECKLHSLTFYPTCLAWRLSISCPPLSTNVAASMVSVLTRQQARGALSRQDLVSMLPVLYLQAEVRHNIVDLCASPGSKTTQLLSLLDSCNLREGGGNAHLASGVVIANEFDRRRIGRLKHRLQKETAAASRVAITNFDAAVFPRFGSGITFDRILADVPCSGDGALHSKLDLEDSEAPEEYMAATDFSGEVSGPFDNWSASEGVRLHEKQVAILQRGLELLGPGGRLVYSTCSINPIENEAVVSHCLSNLANMDMHIRVVDVPDFEGVRARPALLKWLVADPAQDGILYDNFENVPPEARFGSEFCVPGSSKAGNVDDLGSRMERVPITAGMFPQQENASALAKCRRYLPQDNLSGGFFIAIFEKDRPATSTKELLTSKSQSKPNISGSLLSPRGVVGQFLPPHDEDRISITEFYGFTDSFIGEGLMWPTSSQAILGREKICWVTPGMKKFLGNIWGPLAAQSSSLRKRLKQSGMTLMWRLPGKRYACKWQISQEATTLFLPYMSRRRLNFHDINLFMHLVKEGTLDTNTLTQAIEDKRITNWESVCIQEQGGECMIQEPGGLVAVLSSNFSGSKTENSSDYENCAAAVAVVLEPLNIGGGLRVTAPKYDMLGLLEALKSTS